MARTGPVTTDTSSVALGLAQVRIGDSSSNIANAEAVLTASDSIGALANTKFVGNVDWVMLESGFPLIEDHSVPIREAAALECAFKEISPFTMYMAYGKDPAGQTDAHSGELALGAITSAEYVRMEAVYTYPDGTNTMTILFPRAQVTSNVEMDLPTEEFAAVPVTISSKNASSDVTGGNAVWDDKPLGAIEWLDA